MEQIHLEISNPHYGYKGIQPIATTFCQKGLDKETIPTKFKLRKKKKDFMVLVENNAVNLCPDCCKGIVKRQTATEILATEISKSQSNPLLKILYDKTQDLKNQYFEKTEIYAKNYFAYAQKMNALSYEEMVEKFPRKTFIQGKEYISLNKEGSNLRDKVRRIVNSGFDSFFEEEMEAAAIHYIQSIEKLHKRLQEKGIIDSKHVEISNDRIGVNIEMTIKSGEIVVRAWTIIAEGPIQRPHYRYLVK